MNSVGLKILSGAAFILALIPIFLMLWLQLTYGVNILFIDEWWLVHTFSMQRAGTFDIGILWQNNYEHRFFTPRLFFLLASQIQGWNIVTEILFGTIAIIIMLLFFWLLLRKSEQQTPYISLVLPLISAILFSTILWENRLWGFQLAWPVTNLFCIIAIWAISRKPNNLWSFGLAGFCAIAATFSLATAVVVWAAILAYLILAGREWNWRYSLGWIVLGVATLIFNYTVAFNTQNMPAIDSFYFLKRSDYIFQQIGMFGNVLVFWKTDLWVRATAGTIGLLLAGVCIFWLFRRHRKAQDKVWYNALPWITVLLFGIFNGVGILSRRIAWNPESATASRYAEEVIFFWIGLIPLLFIAGRQFYLEKNIRLKAVFLGGIIFVGLAVFSLAYTFSYLEGVNYFKNWKQVMTPALAALTSYPDSPFFMVKNTTSWKKDEVFSQKGQPLLNKMIENKLYVFDPIYRKQIEEQDTKWLNQFKNGENKLYSFPATVMEVSYGGALIEKGTNSIRFKPVDSPDKTSKISVDSYNFEKNENGWQRNRMLDIQAGGAYYLRVYWDTGKGLNESEAQYVIQFRGDKTRFQFEMPENVKSFRVDLFYKPDAPLPEEITVKIDAYAR